MSRGDKSGTHAAELRYWKRAGIDPAAAKPAGSARRSRARIIGRNIGR
jgi:ABC-type tungstate transport system permease subunit